MKIAILFGLLPALLLDSAAFAADATLIQPDVNHRIQNLDFESEDLSLSFVSENGSPVLKTEIRGKFTRLYWTLIWQHVPLDLEKDGSFSVAIVLTGRATTFELVGVGPRGEIAEENITVEVKDWPGLESKAKEKLIRQVRFSPSAGYSLISYQQTAVPQFSESAITLKASGLYAFSETWEAGANVFFNALPFGSSAPRTIQFLGVNLRAGYVLPQIHSPWRLSLMAGYYYTTTFAQGFGYQNVAGLEIYPALQRVLSRGDSLVAYLKYAPVSSGIGLLNLSNHELGGGVSWIRPFGIQKPVSVSFDYANISLDLGATSVNSSSYAVSGGYSL